ncbi:MAG TPA: enoyl-CoA hydratase/isomerase family protein [Acidimicrobiia bacterium]|nr:enoyl-CoA hydratase/isomerase family protein [Acidimicrobiia bacterium]
MFDTIEVSAEGARGRLTLARPEALNALSTHTLREIARAARWFDDQSEVRVVVVSGQGRAFSAGADVKAFVPTEGPADPRADADAGRLAADALERMAAVTIARLHGWCVGGGVVMAAACDLRIAADNTRFSIPEVDLGIPLAWGGIPRLVREIGPAATKELVMTCREFDALEAHRLGFLNRVVPEADLDAAVDDSAATIAAKPWLAITSTKRHVNAVTDGMVQMGRSWSDADGLLAGLRDPEGRNSALAYLERLRRR